MNKVGTDLITSRRVIFTPSGAIKDELKKTSINITCIDRDGKIVKRVTSSDDSEVEDTDNEPIILTVVLRQAQEPERAPALTQATPLASTA